MTPLGPRKSVGEEEARAYHTSDSALTVEARLHFCLAPITLVFVRPSETAEGIYVTSNFNVCKSPAFGSNRTPIAADSFLGVWQNIF